MNSLQYQQLPFTDIELQKPKPFLKWAGGKTQLLAQFDTMYPTELQQGKIDRYVEPFVGGGAVFFDVINKYSIKSAFLFDINIDLVIIYTVVQREVTRLIEILESYSHKYSKLNNENRKIYYYLIRDRLNHQRHEIDLSQFSDEWIQRAGMLLFLNRTCFNGLFRLNSKGEFNVPHGRYKNPRIVDAVNLYSASSALQIANIQLGDFQLCANIITSTSFVYFDPPYRPISDTASFTAYSKFSFGDDEQRRLAQFYTRMDRERGANLMLSNSDPTNEHPEDMFFDDLYRDFNIHRISAHRMINSNGAKRGKIRELLITNYKTSR